MLDIKYVREHLDEVAETMKNRHASFSPEQFTALDVQRREVIAEEEALQAERNKLSKEIGALMGQGKTDEAIAQEGLEAMEAWMKEMGLVLHLAELGVTQDMVEGIAKGSFVMEGGYKVLTHQEIVDILQQSM